MFDNILKIFKRSKKSENKNANSRDTAKERLHLVLMQDRANVSADFLDLMRQEIIEVIKKYIDIDESSMDVRLTNQANEDGTQGAPALYANIPIVNIKDEARKASKVSASDNEEKSNIKKIDEITDEAQKEEEVKKVEEAKKIVQEECGEIEKENKNVQKEGTEDAPKEDAKTDESETSTN